MEDRFFETLAHIMWDMEVDIFSEKNKTLGLAADFEPKCKKQIMRLRAMYDCGAMEKIENAVSDKENYARLMWEAVDLIRDKLHIDEARAVFSVNQIIMLWDGDLPELDGDDDEEQKESNDMLFMQTTAQAEEEKTEEEQKPEEEYDEGGDQPEESAPAQNGEASLLKRIVRYWCEGSCEEGRPLLIACPVGWVLLLLCAAAGCYMVYDVPHADKLAYPSFMMLFSVLLAKRYYKFESAGRFSLMIIAFYLCETAKILYGGLDVPLRCVPIVAAALIVFNNGRFSELLDSQKRRPFAAMVMVLLFSAAAAAGVYAIQNVKM